MTEQRDAVVWLRTTPSREAPPAWASLHRWARVVVGPCARPSPTVCVDPKAALDAARARALRDLQARAHGPGVTYVVKLFLPWILASFDRAVVLDYDLWPRGPGALAGLVAQFDRFLDGEYVALAPDIAAPVLYPRAPLGANGGVQLMRLAEMRAGVWGSMLANHTARVGYLGDQTVYAHLSVAHPGRLRRLSCRWNRQLNAHFHLPTAAYECADGCAIVHGNQPQYKAALGRALVAGSFGPIGEALPKRLLAPLADCDEDPAAPRGRVANDV